MLGLTYFSLNGDVVLFIRNYSMKRVVVKEGKQANVADTPSGDVTPTHEASEKPEGSPSDLEKGSNRGEDDAEDDIAKE